jgi:DNA-binding NarL/FixJ family response regulator
MRILIADDHGLFRDGLRSLLEARGVEVVGEARNGREAVDLALRLDPDIVLMDLAMPELSGLEATRILSTRSEQTHVIVVTASEDDADLFEAIKSGAEGYVFKNLKADEFFELLAGFARGEPALSPSLARKLLREFSRPAESETRTPQPDALTQREREVLELLVDGVTSNHDLAQRLCVSENTVKYHLRNILDKLHLRNRAQVVAYALRSGMLDPRKSGPTP